VIDEQASARLPSPVPSGRDLVRGSELTFTSLRYGYSVTMIADEWVADETPGSWDGRFDPQRLDPDPGTDWLRDPRGATIEIGVLAVVPGTTLAAWEASEAPAVRVLACKEVPPPDSAMAASTRVLLLPETCPKPAVGETLGDQYVLNAFLVHGTSGLVAQWESEQGHEAADRASFLAILATWTWASR
jgi:hypothetical protein